MERSQALSLVVEMKGEITHEKVFSENAVTFASVGNDYVEVSAQSFVVPMKNATIAKDYSSSELQFNDTLKQWEIHKAIDFVAGENLNVFAVTDIGLSILFTARITFFPAFKAFVIISKCR